MAEFLNRSKLARLETRLLSRLGLSAFVFKTRLVEKVDKMSMKNVKRNHWNFKINFYLEITRNNDAVKPSVTFLLWSKLTCLKNTLVLYLEALLDSSVQALCCKN